MNNIEKISALLENTDKLFDEARSSYIYGKKFDHELFTKVANGIQELYFKETDGEPSKVGAALRGLYLEEYGLLTAYQSLIPVADENIEDFVSSQLVICDFTNYILMGNIEEDFIKLTSTVFEKTHYKDYDDKVDLRYENGDFSSYKNFVKETGMKQVY